jgi:hypothetical protein
MLTSLPSRQDQQVQIGWLCLHRCSSLSPGTRWPWTWKKDEKGVLGMSSLFQTGKIIFVFFAAKFYIDEINNNCCMCVLDLIQLFKQAEEPLFLGQNSHDYLKCRLFPFL